MDVQDEPTLQPVADGVFAWVRPDGGSWFGNAGAIATAGGVILIDTPAGEERAQGLLWAVAHATSGAPVRFAVSTRPHGDHAPGYRLLPDHTVIIGHEATPADWPGNPVTDRFLPPSEPDPGRAVTRHALTLTVRGGLTLRHGNHRVELHQPGFPGHPAGGLVAWLPWQGVLFTGDLLATQVTPLPILGSIEGNLRALDWIADFLPDHVVPGHGPVIHASGLPAVLDAHRRYYRLVLATARAGARDGLPPLEAARRCDLGAFANLPEAQRIVLNLHRAYADAAGGELDIVRAIDDTVAYNSRPLRATV